VKLDSNTAICSAGCGLDIIARDHHGDALPSAHKWIQPHLPIVLGEAKEAGFSKIMLESGCLQGYLGQRR